MSANRKVLIIGDSHAKGYLPHSRIDSDAIANRLGTPDHLRQAVSGSTAREWALDRDSRLAHAQISAGEADATLISLCGNDLFKMAADGVVDDSEIAQMGCHLTHVLTELALPSRRTFVMLYGYPFKDVRAQALMAVQRLDAFIAATAAAVAEIHNIKIETIDERLILLPEDWPGDDIHPFESGYFRLADEIDRRMGA